MTSATQLFLRVLLVALMLGGSGLLFGYGFPYTGSLLFLFALLALAALYQAIRSRALVYDKTIEAILQHDFSSRLPASYRTGNYATLYRLFETQRQKQHEQVSREELFRSILHDIDTAILILRKEDDDWTVFLMNRQFSSVFGVPAFRQWTMLKDRLPSFCAVIENSGFAEMKTSADIRIDESETQTFSVRTSRTDSFGQTYYSILLDSIQSVVEKKEKQAWINLMNVISHELMNSLTPIHSLSQSLQQVFSGDTITDDDLDDVRKSLSTIANRTQHLQSFVENYRKLTLLPSPAKVPTSLPELIASCVSLMQLVFDSEGIAVETDIQAITVELDRQQMEQVIINLLTNSVHAVKEQAPKAIRIASIVENHRLYITLWDSGKGVEKEIRDKIFQPFFTTRKEGAGIGLTLSRNITEAHGGYLHYAPEGEGARFVVTLPYR